VVGGTAGGVQGGVTGGISGRAYSKEEIAALAKLPPIRAEGPISPPQIVKQVEPIYPEVARQGRVEGIVILEITTDIYGRVMNLKVLRSIPLLDQAAIEAVKQWVYEPLIIEGKPRGCIFTATVRFTLK
jgi:protein TonB